MAQIRPQVLRTDASGTPLEWIDYEQAAKLLTLDMVQYTHGEILTRLHGGINSITRRQSYLDINAIIGTKGNNFDLHKKLGHYVPPLTNQTLFKRDQNLCLYCGKQFYKVDLSRDHIQPISQGGRDSWTNVVSACKRCNNHKANRTPAQANMKLLAIPFAPNHAEYIFLQGRHIIADQMAYLMHHFPRQSRLRQLSA